MFMFRSNQSYWDENLFSHCVCFKTSRKAIINCFSSRLRSPLLTRWILNFILTFRFFFRSCPCWELIYCSQTTRRLVNFVPRWLGAWSKSNSRREHNNTAQNEAYKKNTQKRLENRSTGEVARSLCVLLSNNLHFELENFMLPKRICWLIQNSAGGWRSFK